MPDIFYPIIFQQFMFGAHEDEDDTHTNLLLRKTIGNGPPDSTQEFDSELPNQNANNQSFSRQHWRLLQCQNGDLFLVALFHCLAVHTAMTFKEAYLRLELGIDCWLLLILPPFIVSLMQPRSCSRAMKAVGIVKATCEEIFELVMSMDGTRWDSTFQYGSLVEEVDGHTAILYHRLQLDWFPIEHENCGPQPGHVRAHVESGGFSISHLKHRNGRPRTQVTQIMQIDLKGWGVGYISSFQQHCLLQMLNNIAAPYVVTLICFELLPLIWKTGFGDYVNRVPKEMKGVLIQESHAVPMDEYSDEDEEFQIAEEEVENNSRRTGSALLMDEYSDEDEECQIAEEEVEAYLTQHKNNSKRTALEEPVDQIDLSCFSGNLHRDDRDNARDCWKISVGDNFRVRSKRFGYDKSKVPAGKHLMDLVAVDWFKDTKRMDHVARCRGSAAQVPGPTHYSMVFYFVTKELVPGSLLQRFVDGDDEFRNSRFKLIPSVLKGSWIMRQSIGSTPCLLGKAVDCNYIRGPKYLEVDVDIGSSAVATGVLRLVMGAVTALVVDMAFLVQANTAEELPERLIGAVRVSHIELSSAIFPKFHPDSSRLTEIILH
ncbi:unnamed protein product [Dovyalis caffra]|uniref:START domain-containing protein n=1 Tax=Dovyalis caffra TaxID=77055 RepID=A0AAV1REX7_9ROSI|nr:unnamed protein product [Dovyalis caffra]